MGTKLAMVGNFTRNVGLANLRPRATVQVKKFVQAGSSATVDNATNFETSNDSELAATAVTVNQISKLFTVTQQELNQGFALADLAAGSADVFALGISKKITAVMTSANYGAGTTIGTAANFDTSDLPADLGSRQELPPEAAVAGRWASRSPPVLGGCEHLPRCSLRPVEQRPVRL